MILCPLTANWENSYHSTLEVVSAIYMYSRLENTVLNLSSTKELTIGKCDKYYKLSHFHLTLQHNCESR